MPIELDGQPKKGRPRKHPPKPTPDPEAPVLLTTLDGSDQRRLRETEWLKSEEAREWKQRMSGQTALDIPEAMRKRYPDNQWCWVPTEPSRRSQYVNQYGYSPPPEKPIVFRDLQLMMRPSQLEALHRQVEAEAAAQAMGQPAPTLEEREAATESRRFARFVRGEVRQDTMQDKDFIEEPDRDDYDVRDHAREMAERPKGAAGRGSKFWTGGIPA